MEVININRNQFEEMVHSGKTVLVEFSAPWCVYCRRLAPSLESVAEEYKDTLVFTAVNIDDEPYSTDLSQRTGSWLYRRSRIQSAAGGFY